MSWQKYYNIRSVEGIFPRVPGINLVIGWYIVFNEDSATPGRAAWWVSYRTEKNAIRGAERLYNREIGHLETAFELTE
jgi:hypothetical protein